MKLTNDMRSKLARNVADEKFKPEIERVEKELGLVATDLYEREYPPNIRKTMADLPHGAFQQQRDVDFKVNGKRYTIYLPEPRMVFATHLYGLHVVDAPAEVLAYALRLNMELEALRRRCTDLAVTLRHELQSVTTDKKLLELWPESKKFVDEVCGQRPVENPPAVITDFQALIAQA